MAFLFGLHPGPQGVSEPAVGWCGRLVCGGRLSLRENTSPPVACPAGLEGGGQLTGRLFIYWSSPLTCSAGAELARVAHILCTAVSAVPSPREAAGWGAGVTRPGLHTEVLSAWAPGQGQVALQAPAARGRHPLAVWQEGIL